jgi:hypothetical protein
MSSNIEVDAVLARFRLFLETSFSHIDPIYAGNENEEDLKDAWLQANWELLVERILCRGFEFLVEYGVGADLYDDFTSRIFYPRGVATHKITVHSRYDRPVANLLDSKLIQLDSPELELDFYKFCYSHGGFYYTFQAPLNCVLLEGSNNYLAAVSLDCVTFRKTPLNKNKQ